MPALIQRYATPLITGLFIVSLVSGIALFFHVGQAYFHGMHEWLSMVLILPFVLHLWKNWRAMTTYFAKPAFAVAMGLSLVGGAVFAYQGANNASGGPPQMALARMILASLPRRWHHCSTSLPKSLPRNLPQRVSQPRRPGRASPTSPRPPASPTWNWPACWRGPATERRGPRPVRGPAIMWISSNC